MRRIRVLVVDDHRIFAESLAAALAAEQDVEVAAAGSGPAALRCLERGVAEGRRFDVLLVDADLAAPSNGGPAAPAAGGPAAPGATAPRDGLPGGPPPPSAPNGPGDGRPPARSGAPPGPPAEPANAPPGGTPGGTAGAAAAATGGISLLTRTRSEYPKLRTVMLAERDDPRHAAAALQAGAGGWVAKDCSLSRLLQVIRGVLKDETHLSPALLTGVLKELTASRKHRTESERLVGSLTPREREVLRCMVAGLGRKAVAERLFLSPHTVRTHMQNVLGKLGVHSTLAAVALARRAGVGPAELGQGTARSPAAG
ncbi:response regulator transcription factor [Streptomyces sp. AJS327]|uniref:response regulator transcription factor n=1 Tax=Streptomyces sp. AJS327 TaxID=2545265 RepID=UPI0015DDA0D6|nr:response regulator transcription factor [Streptomyces sp. AJS327]MBA0049384.1 response regulator transcription factor [Streptomyces sp. AJS327]